MKSKKTWLSILLSAMVMRVCAQGELPVNMYTGTPIISVPLGAVSDHDLTQPIGLTYNAKGVRLDEPTGDFGIGWNLEFGGSIRREVRGLPDDYTGTGSDARRGWLYKNASQVAVGADVATLSNASNLSAADCADELNDFNKINGFGYLDTEPDIFFYDFNGMSGSFVFDNADPATIRLMPYADIIIQPVFGSGSDKTLYKFRITDNNGIIYYFDLASTENKLTRKAANVTNVDFLSTDFQLYDSAYINGVGGVSYRTEWMLTKIESHTGANISYQYTSKSYSMRDTVRAYVRNYYFGDDQAYTIKNIYSTNRSGSRRRISSITASSGPLAEFTFAGDAFDLLTKVVFKDTRRPSTDQYVKEFDMGYSARQYQSYTRKFLRTVSEISGCDQLPPYTFNYAGDGGDMWTYTNLPPPSSKSKDFWGYFNGKKNTTLAPQIYVYPLLEVSERYRIYPKPNYSGTTYTIWGADRTADDNAIVVGTLNNIKYPAGGSTTIEYEPNKYYDAVAGAEFYGGGLRVKRITYFDGINAAANIVKDYSYVDNNNASSGRVLAKPTFVIPTFEYRDPQSSAVYSYSTLNSTHPAELHELLTVRVEDDMTPNVFTQGSRVGYKNVKVSRPGAGYATYEFLMPATFGDAATGNWAPSANKFARSSACPGMGIISSGGNWAFPYATDPNYDYERGLVYKVQNFDVNTNNVVNLVSETVNTYQNLFASGSSPTSVWGVRYEKFPYGANTFLFSKYNLLTNVTKVLASVTSTTYDAATTTKKMVEQVDTYYESANHKLPTRIQKTNPDGSVFTQRLKYPLDYGTITLPVNDKASEMLKRLQSDVLSTITINRNATPIEVLSTTGTGANEKVLSGGVIKFHDFDKAKPLLQDQLSLSLSTPVLLSAFAQSQYNSTSKIFTTDSRYEVVSTALAYDNYEKPKSVVGQGKTVSSTLWGYGASVLVAAIKNASAGEFAFSDFETTTGAEFSLNYTNTGAGRSGTYGLLPFVTMSKSLTKNGNKYILSLWFKGMGTVNQTFTITVKNASGTTVSGYPLTWTINATSTDYEYKEKVLDISAVSSSTFSITIQGADSWGDWIPGSGHNATVLPMIDDVALYPADADIASSTFTIPYGANSATSRGKGSFTQYDKLGRVKYTFDQFKNITSKTTIATPADPTRSFTPIISLPASNNIFDGPNTFSAQDVCIDGTTYEWDFGTGQGFVQGKDQIFSYTTSGLKTVTLRISHPMYATTTVTRQFTVTLKDCNVSVCAKGVKEYNQCLGTTVSTYSCSNITSTPPVLGTTFRVTGIDVSESINTYQWKIRNTGTTTWSNALTTQEYAGMKITPGTTPSYEVMCVITTSTGRVGYSPITYVTVTTTCN